MNCERQQIDLEDFIYGELTERRASEVRAHLTACADCRAALQQLERENEILTQFQQETSYEPPGEMWAVIRSRINDEKPVVNQQPVGESEMQGWAAGLSAWLKRPLVFRQLAFALLIALVSVVATFMFLKRDQQLPNSGQDQTRNVARDEAGDKARVTPSPGSTPILSSPPQVTISPDPDETATIAKLNPLKAGERQGSESASKRVATATKKLTEQELLSRQIARAEREYQGAIRLLDRAIAKRRDSFDPAVIKQYEASLALIDSSIQQSRESLRAQPEDVAARQFLLAAYAKKVELMQDIALK